MGVVAGGYLPAELRGTKNFATIHVADWCECSNGLPHHLSRHAVVRRRPLLPTEPTLCNLVAVSPTDTVTVAGAPRPIDGLVRSQPLA